MKDTTTTFEMDDLIALLGIGELSLELKAKIVAKFGEVLFKRLLLLLPDEQGSETIREITTLSVDEGMQLLIQILDRELPNSETARGAVFESTVAEFKLGAGA